MPGSVQCRELPVNHALANWGTITRHGPNPGSVGPDHPGEHAGDGAARRRAGSEHDCGSAQVALIPVFQFGVFSESDLSFHSGANFDMAGPLHTNADLYPFVGPEHT